MTSLTEIIDIEIDLAAKGKIAGTLYKPNDITNMKGAVMIGPATGIKRSFYAAFASYLAAHDYGVLTYDNRGIGDSRNAKLRDVGVSLQEWGFEDMPAALARLKSEFPGTKYHLVGHSAGGQLFGLMHNWSALTSVFNYACSSGCIKNMSGPFWLQAIFFMRIFIPLSNRVYGFTQTQWVGMGEPLPANVAQQWAHWCLGQGYAKTAFGHSIHEHWYDDVDLPSLWINAIDDDIANDANVDDMIAVMPKLRAEKMTLIPEDHDLQSIGHMKFFSRKSKILWDYCLKWLDQF